MLSVFIFSQNVLLTKNPQHHKLDFIQIRKKYNFTRLIHCFIFITGCHRHRTGLQNLRQKKNNRIKFSEQKKKNLHNPSLPRAYICAGFLLIKDVCSCFFLLFPPALFHFALRMKLLSCDTC